MIGGADATNDRSNERGEAARYILIPLLEQGVLTWVKGMTRLVTWMAREKKGRVGKV
jgi:hypothetical protein